MKKNDFWLIGIVLLLAVSISVFLILKGKGGDAEVVIKVGGELYGKYDLSAGQTVDIDGMNTLEIKGGQADMKAADCPDMLCVHQKAISKDGESIICLPNKIVVTIEGGGDSRFDAVTG